MVFKLPHIKGQCLSFFFSSFLYIFFIGFIFFTLFFSCGRIYAGDVSGKIYKYSNSTLLTDVSVRVSAFDSTNVEKGFATTSNGSYKISSLPAGKYRICATAQDYVIENYTPGCTGKNCGYYWFADPNDILKNMLDVGSTTITNINFYLCKGGKIQGNIYTDTNNPNGAYTITVSGTVFYKSQSPLSIGYFDTNNIHNAYSTNIPLPSGDYIVKVEDSSRGMKTIPVLKNFNLLYSNDYPYYCPVYYSNKYSSEQADILHFDLDQSIPHTANITLREGGLIYGCVKEGVTKEKMIEGVVTLKEKNYNYERSTHSIVTYLDANSDLQNERGIFLITGLPPGNYMLTLEFKPTLQNQIYLKEYYNNKYLEDANITLLNISNRQKLNIGDIFLDRAPKVDGWVIEGEPNQCSQYIADKALDGIRVEIVPYNFTWVSHLQNTGTNGNYLFDSFKRIVPGTYKIRAIDTQFVYFSSDYQIITLVQNTPNPNGTSDPNHVPYPYHVNFCLKKVPPGTGNGTISGHVYRDEDTTQPLSGIKILAVNVIKQNQFQYYETNTNSSGSYLLDNLTPGEYYLLTNEVSKSQYNDLIGEFHKDISILDPNKFVEGSKLDFSMATQIPLFPGDHITGIDIALSSYKYTFDKGLNFFGYPGIPVEKYNDSYSFCAPLGTNMHDFRWRDPVTGRWYMTTANVQNRGDTIEISTGRGYLIYMNSQKGPLYYPPFKSFPPSSYDLRPGKNFIAYPSSLQRPIKKSYELLTSIGTQNTVANVQTFDNTRDENHIPSGKWFSSVWFWGKPCGKNFPIEQGGGYMVEMKSSKTFIPPTN